MSPRMFPRALVPTLIVFVVVSGFVFRLVFSLTSGGLVRGSDPDAYVAIARNLATGQGFASVAEQPTAYRPPGYPVFLAAVLRMSNMSFAAAAVVQSVLAALIITAAAGIADLIAGPRSALAAAVLVACDPFLVHTSGQAMTETLFTFFLMSAIFFLLRSLREPSLGRLLLAAVSLTAAGLTRPIAYALFPLVVPFAFKLKISPLRRLAATVCVLLVPAALTAPWVARNFARFGAFIPTTTHGGYTLVLGNNPHLEQAIREDELPWLPGKPTRDSFDREIAEVRRDSSELEFDRRMWRAGKDFIRENPSVAAGLAWEKIKFLWRPAPWHTSVEGPIPTAIRLGLGAFAVLLYIGALAGLISLGRRPLMLVLCLSPIVLFTLVHAVVWSQLRFRIPLHPLLAALAAAGFVTFVTGLSGRDKPCAA